MTEPKTELQRNALAEVRRIELETFQRALDVQWLNSRMEDGRMSRCIALINREAEMEKDFQERTDHAAIVNTRAQKEAALGIEVAKIRDEESCKLLRRHYLRDRDPSLRELMTKLTSGYICRDLQQQILHNEYRRLQEKAEDKRANDILADALFSDKEQQLREEQSKADVAKYRRELQQQLVNRQRQKQCQYEDSLIEKKMLDDIMRTISDEDQRELKQKRDTAERIRHEMETFAKARNSWKEKQKTMVIVEEKEIERQKKAMSDRSASVIAERKRKMQEKEELNARMAARVLADEAENQKRTDIIRELQEQEYLEKNAEDDKAENEKLARTKQDTQEALTEQMNQRKKLAQEQRENDAAFRRETEKKIALEDEKEREKNRQLFEKNRTYSQQLMKQIEENKKYRAKAEEIEARRLADIKNYYHKWDEEVANERKTIVEEHAPPLLGYLQAGVLKVSDLPTVRAGANRSQDLAKLDIEGMAISNRPKRFAKCNAQCMRIREY